jgi:glycosyltransferase involved in cell wall biosynthesis
VPVVVNIQDLFPREAVELGMLTSRPLIRVFEHIERQVHHMAAAITVHSPGNRAHVIAHGGAPERTRVIYNYVDTNRIQPGRRQNEFARQHGLYDHFVVSYAGTMGWAQDMATIVEAAVCLRQRPAIRFLLVGDGVEKQKALDKSNTLGLTNIIWLPMQPADVYPHILAASDVSMINLNPDLRTPVVPSKLLSIMAAGRPVVASLPAESDARWIIDDAGCGLCVPAGDGGALAHAIEQLADDPVLAHDMGASGRAYVETHFARPVITAQIEALLEEVRHGPVAKAARAPRGGIA